MDPLSHDDAEAAAVFPEESTTTPEDDVALPHSSNLDDAVSAFEEALGLIDKDEQPGYYGVVLHDIAQTYDVAERCDVAAELYSESARFKRRGDNLADLSTTLVSLTRCLMSSARLDDAVGTLGEAKEALDLSAPGLETTDLFIRTHEIALLYESLGNRGVASAYGDAMTAYERSLELVDKEADPVTYGYVMRNIGDVHSATGQLRDSLSAYSEAVSLLRRTDERAGLASALIDLGRMSRRLAEADGQRFLNDDAARRPAAWLSGDDDAGGGTEAPPATE